MPRSGFEEGFVGSPQRSTESLDSCFFYLISRVEIHSFCYVVLP